MRDVHVRNKNHTKTCECMSERNTVTMDECFWIKAPQWCACLLQTHCNDNSQILNPKFNSSFLVSHQSVSESLCFKRITGNHQFVEPTSTLQKSSLPPPSPPSPPPPPPRAPPLHAPATFTSTYSSCDWIKWMATANEHRVDILVVLNLSLRGSWLFCSTALSSKMRCIVYVGLTVSVRDRCYSSHARQVFKA